MDTLNSTTDSPDTRPVAGVRDDAQLLAELSRAKRALEDRNDHLFDLYRTAQRFIENVSHEFRTPLTVIREFVACLRDDQVGSTSGQQREYLEVIGHRVDDLIVMVDDLVDIAKLESGELIVWRTRSRVEDIVESIRPTLLRRAARSKVRLDVVLDAELPDVYCDAEKAGRVILNLVTNALKFSAEGCSVRLHIQAHPASAEVRIAVEDHGPGIEPENLQVIFDRFSQVGGPVRSSTKGFGLGLNIARQLVQLSFGDIDVESRLGSGSTFSFTLPVADVASLMYRYLERVERIRHGSDFVSLLEVVAAPSRQSQAAPLALEPGQRPPTLTADEIREVEHFLLRNLRRTDLVVARAPGVWVLVVPTHQNTLASIMDRLHAKREALVSESPSKQVPALTMSVAGTWRVKGDRDEFVKRCVAELQLTLPDATRATAVSSASAS